MNLYGPVEGKRHDSSLLAESGLLEKLDMFSFAPDGTPSCFYGDPILYEYIYKLVSLVHN